MEAGGSCTVLPAIVRQDGGERQGKSMAQTRGLGVSWGQVKAHSRAASQIRVVYLIAKAQPQLAAFLSQWPHGLPQCSCQHP